MCHYVQILHYMANYNTCLLLFKREVSSHGFKSGNFSFLKVFYLNPSYIILMKRFFVMAFHFLPPTFMKCDRYHAMKAEFWENMTSETFLDGRIKIFKIIQVGLCTLIYNALPCFTYLSAVMIRYRAMLIYML